VIVDFKTGTQTKDKDIKYQKQLEFYKEVMVESSFNIVDLKLLWL